MLIKKSGFYTLTYLVIDELGHGNYTWAEALGQDWCRYKDGTYIIENITIDGKNLLNRPCIEIRNSDVQFLIKNCTLSYPGGSPGSPTAALKLENVSNGRIENNTCRYSYYGIFLNNSVNINVTENDACYCSFREIYLLNSNNSIISSNSIRHLGASSSGVYFYNSNDNQIINNYITDCNQGVYTLSSKNIYIYNNTLVNSNFNGIYMDNGHDSEIVNNNISKNEQYGIQVSNSDDMTIIGNEISYNGQDGDYDGIYMNMCDKNVFTSNIISYNTRKGMRILYCNDNDINGNTISLNEDCGIDINDFSYNNTIYNNYFIDNSINARDNGTNNKWDYNGRGNYWSDYQGFDKNDDGIGDTPYNITGLANSTDHFPIWDDGLEFNIWSLLTPIILISSISLIGIVVIIIYRKKHV